jgi:anaphase-promoting complex subunit 2
MSAAVQESELAVNGFENSTTDILNWLSSQIFSKSLTQDFNLPYSVKTIIRNYSDSHIFLPVFQRLIYSHSPHLAEFYHNDVLTFFKWIELSSTQMNLLYMVFKFNNNDVILLKRSEFSIYQGFIELIWNDILTTFKETTSWDNLYFISKVLMKINLYDELDDLIFQLSKLKIMEKINSIYYEGPIFEKLNNWIVDDLFISFESLVSFENAKDFKECLLLIAKNILISKRIEQIYLLVANYPDSKETLKEFNVCINKSTQKNLLVDNFIANLYKTLLIPSIKTIDIILYYIKTIHSFLIIDHRGVLLDKVARPIRHYLSVRNDTIEKVVEGLLDTNRYTNKLIELNDELNKNHLNNNNPNSILNQQKRTLNWQPDPVDALPDFQIGKIDDIIDSLTSIFNDNSLFINQFVKIFSVDLLNIENYNIQNTMENLNLLKTKFHNYDFNKIDIMINDIVKSKELNRKINSANNTFKDYKVNGIFLSHLYWPNLTADIPLFEFPSTIKANLEDYQKEYKTFQKGRILKLRPDHSTVNVTVEIQGIKKNYNVTLDKLSVLNFFNESNLPIVKLGIIMMKLKMSLQLLKSSLEFWVKENIIAEVNGGWKLNE